LSVSQQFGEIGAVFTVEPMLPEAENLINLAVAQSPDGITLAIGRRLVRAAEKGKLDTQSDITELAAVAWDGSGQLISNQVLTTPQKIGNNTIRTFEDLRMVQTSLGQWALGGTDVVTKIGADGGWETHPAIFETTFEELLAGRLPEPYVVEAIQMPPGESAETHGKNMTPIGKEDLWLFRPDGTENNHRLHVVRYDGTEAVHAQFIDLPTDLPWAQHKLGTTGPPIWINEREAIFPLHGMNLIDGVYVYAIGAARLSIDDEGLLHIDHISRTPLIHPDHFIDPASKIQDVELHAERRVVYVSAMIQEVGDDGVHYVSMFVNVGDKKSVKVKIPQDQLTQGWASADLTR